MAGELNIELANALTSPSDTFSIRTQNRDFGTQRLSSDEASLFETQFNTLINDLDSRLVSEMFMQRRQNIADALALSKNQFDERLFGGINAADNEIGFDMLRPGHVRADPATGDTVNDWYYTHEDGWNDWIGDGGDNDYVVDDDQVVLVLGVVDPGALVFDDETEELVDHLAYTPTSGIDVDRFGRNVDMLPKDLNDGKLLDNDNDVLMQSVPTLVGTDRDRVHIQLRSDVPDELSDYTILSQPRLVGLTFGVGAYMNEQDY